MARRVLVTGGAGFIGSNLVDACVERGDEVVVLDNLSTGHAANVNGDARLVVGCITDLDTVRSAVNGCDTVFHLAAARSVLRSVEAPLETDRVNVGGTLKVLTAARDAGVKRFVSSSSSSVYGGVAIRPTPESSPLSPKSPYAVTKMTGEQYCRVYWELFGLETVSLRYFNVYGPRQRPDSAYAAVIPLFIDALRNGRSPVVHGDGRQSRDFTFVTDAVAANLAASTAGAERCAGRAFNVAGGRPHSLLHLLDVLQATLGTSIAPTHTAPRAGDIRNSCACVDAAAEALGWSAQVPFRDGIRRTLDWFTSRD